VIDNPDRVQAAGLNRILAEARGEIVVRMDVHCEYAPDYVEQCVTVLERTGADSVGGAQRCRGRTPFEKVVCAALESPLGVGGAAYRSAGREGFVDTVFLGAYRRAVFERVGRWDPAAITNEDAELNQRLVRSGGRIYLSREVVVYYAPRDSFTALARQYFRYGRGRARTLLKHRELLSPRPALPFLGLLAGLSMLALAPRTGLVAASAYAGVTFAEALRVGWRDGLPSAIRAWGVFPTLHLAHATGFGVGLVRYALARDW
jgi:GT2 family glycosyltransferase